MRQWMNDNGRPMKLLGHEVSSVPVLEDLALSSSKLSSSPTLRPHLDSTLGPFDLDQDADDVLQALQLLEEDYVQGRLEPPLIALAKIAALQHGGMGRLVWFAQYTAEPFESWNFHYLL